MRARCFAILGATAACSTAAPRPAPKPKPVEVKPGPSCLRPQQVMTTLEAHKQEIIACINASNHEDNRRDYAVERMYWSVEATGKAVHVRYLDQDSPTFGLCMTAAIASWPFPPCEASKNIVFPFEF